MNEESQMGISDQEKQAGLNTSVTYEEKRKGRTLRCLGFNLVCQLLIISSVVTSIIIFPWLTFTYNCKSRGC